MKTIVLEDHLKGGSLAVPGASIDLNGESRACGASFPFAAASTDSGWHWKRPDVNTPLRVKSFMIEVAKNVYCFTVLPRPCQAAQSPFLNLRGHQ